MKNINKILLGGLALSLVLSSCSIEKRVHNPGYHISWKNSKHATHKETETEERIVLKRANPVENPKENPLKAEENARFDVVPADKITQETTVVTAEIPETKSVSRSKQEQTQIAGKKIADQLVSPDASELTFKSFGKQKQLASKTIQKEIKQPMADDRLILLYILAILLPVIAVGIVTDWEAGPVLLSILLMILFWLPAIIHAIIVVHNNA